MKGLIAAEAPASVFKGFRVFGRPYTVLVDKTSKVAAFTYPGEVKEETIAALIEGKTPAHGEALEDLAVKNSSASARPLAEFYLVSSANNSGGRANYGPASLSAVSMPLVSILEGIFASADKVEPDTVTKTFKLISPF